MPKGVPMSEEQKEKLRAKYRERAAAGKPSVPPTARAGQSKRSVQVLGTMAWGFCSLPVSFLSPSGGAVMRLQMPVAGREIDTILKGTALYDALTSGGTGEKAVAAFHLGAPVMLCVAGDQMARMQARDPENPRIGAMIAWLQLMLQQVLDEQGLRIPATPPQPQPRPKAEPSPPRVAPPSETPEPSGPASSQKAPDRPEGNGEVPVELAQKAAETSRFDALE